MSNSEAASEPRPLAANGSDSESDDEVGAQAPPLTKQISNILNRYPEGGQILKELIQNADDAQAEHVGFLIDWRQHPTDDVMNPNFKEYQGPALYAWNSAVFKDNDWTSLGKINQSSKEEDVLKVGRFGLGFQSVFHITDLPMVISQKHIAIIDPHKKCIKPKSETSPAGTKKKLSSFFKHASHKSTFESIFDLNTADLADLGLGYNGTIFRFPLRQPNSGSKISNTSYTPKKIQTTLFESLKEESPYILLFLRHIESISLMEWKEGSSEPHEMFRVDILDQKPSYISSEAPTSIEQFARQYSQSSEDGDLQVSVELKSKTVTINNFTEGSSELHHWLVLKIVGTNDIDLDKLGKELSILPWVGLATKLPQQVALHECSANTTDPFNDHRTVEAIFKQLETNLIKSQITMSWPTNSADNEVGHAYCFLPLPESTAMPVHVHGYFAVTDNRRSIKWPMHDEKGKEAQWNKELLYKMVAPAYGLLLSSRASLTCYEDTPLPIANTEHVTDAYSSWPLYPEVKNVPIWNELVSPTMDFSCSLPLLWTSACGGKWIQFSEAYFHPGSFKDSSSYTCSDVVIQLIVTLGIPVVSLPRSICETIKQSKNVLPLVDQREISPQFVREIISKQPDSCSSLSKDEICKILDFVLSDLGQATYALLEGIPLLPLKGDSKGTVFQRPSWYTEYKYIFPPNMKHLLDIVPGADSLIVDPNLPEEISTKLCEIARSGLLQLKEVDTEVICKQLLPTSINSWCTVTTGAGWRWVPGQDSMPPQSWMDSLWKWIADSQVNLSLLEGLQIVPQLPFDDSPWPQEQVTLIKVCKAANMCRLSGLFSSQKKPLLLSILKKLKFLVVDEGKMNNCVSLKNHPDFEEYVPKLSLNLELIVKHLNRLGLSWRLQAVQYLNDGEKDFLRKQFSHLHDSYAQSYQSCLRSLSIYHAYRNSSFISLGIVGSTDEAFLPPDNIPPLPDYPNKMLCPATSPEERSFFTALTVKQLSVDNLCTLYLIPMALKHIRNSPYQWSTGDELILWILKLQPQLSRDVFTCLSQYAVIHNRNFKRKKPRDIYDPHDHTLAILFDVDNDKEYFPDARYLQETHCKQALLIMGMKTWKDVQRDSNQMYTLLHDRMNSVHTLQASSQFNRGQFILQTLTEPNNSTLQQNVTLKKVKFLVSETCPRSYPPCLKEKWYGRQGTLYSIEELCSPDNRLPNSQLIGTVKPILSRDYCRGQYPVSVNAFEKLACQKVKEKFVLSHLQNIQSTTISSEEADSVHQIVMSIYDYLDTKSSERKLDYIWWRESSGFMPANKFILHLPDGLQFKLEPFYYCLQGPVRKHKRLFQLHNPLSLSIVATLITKISQQAGGKLSDSQVALCVSILNWLCERKYEGSSVLMLTEKCTLVSAKECVFDDREWMKHSENRSHIEGKNLVFVHDRIPQKVAKYFQVKPLSSQVARSQKLNFGLKYTKAGQHEDLTQRIRHIVEEYGTNIDIFKELIQNADDAGATEVKFLIDWREHPRTSLFSDELKKWQGPALIAYNNATFSDEDFDNICNLAGETKKTDPLKTGRFGVGFCATYHLTDLPSFISRRCFAMFDPHTLYLGDRISSREPGMRIDLVETQGDLRFYEDQFKPYENVFGCNVLNLQGNGYQGTIFRFPFRDYHTNRSSKICREVYDRRKVNNLVRALKDQSSELLLFLKSVSKVSVLELEDGREPSDAKEIFSVRRCTEGTEERVQLIRTGGLNLRAEGKTCSTKYRVDVCDGSKKHSHTWIVSSAIQPLPANMTRSREAKGLLYLAEAALKIEEPTSTDSFKILSNTASRVFCFLPLPNQIKLPFHVNATFSMGSDRRTVSATDDNTFGPAWNKLLAEGVLVTAFVNLLERLCRECDLKSVSDSKVKEKLLRSYYSLWNMAGMSSLIDASFAVAFKKLVPTLNSPIMWSEINGGRWLSPTSVYVFKDSKLRLPKQSKHGTDVHEAIENDAISLLMKQGYGIVDIPYHMHEILKKLLSNNKREYDYQRVCTEILFPAITMCTITPTVRDRNMKFLIEQYGTYLGKDNWYTWAESFIRQKPCISCESSSTLRPACELIDPRNEHFVNLFNANEGRFPCKELQESPHTMSGLKRLGMTSEQLSIADLKGRAQSIATMSDFQTAFQRSVHLCEYIESTYGGHSMSSYYHYKSVRSNTADPNDLQHLSNIRFLPVKQKPEGVDVPWSGKSESFDSPSQMYSSEYQSLVFTQSPIVEAEVISNKAQKCLGISSKKPSFELVVANLQCLICNTVSIPNEVTTKFLDDAVKEMYTFLQPFHSLPSTLNILTQIKMFIWQDGHFLRVDQVVGHWNHSCYPYICELSSSNKQFLNLMTAIGVKGEVTLEMLVEIFKKITEEHGCDPISDQVLEFVVYTAGRVEDKLTMQYKHGHSFQLYLPDEKKIMRNVSDLADNVGSESEWIQSLPAYQNFKSSGTGYYVHKNIPHECAKVLGVNPLLEAVLKEMEDEDFLDGTDFGQHEDLCDRLNGILRKYPADISIFKEFIQNADDAQATEIVFVMDHRTDFPDNSLLNPNLKWKSLQHTPALCIYNNRKFTEKDIEGITKLGRGGKSGSMELIGKFGVGFNVAYHVTDCPSFVSYSENGTPEYLCVFDPTQSFVSRATKRSPGRKWNFKDKTHHSGFTDQFRPYLPEDLHQLSECTSGCLQDGENYGHVVFRLPLTRYSRTKPSKTYVSSDSKPTKPILSSGYKFWPFEIRTLFEQLTLISQDILLFLNHLKSVSAFEIKEDGSVVHHFTSTAVIPSTYLDNCRQFTQSLKQYSTSMKRVSMTHKVEISHIQPEKETQKTEWLIQRAIGGDLPSKLVQNGFNQGLRPIAGIATILKPQTNDHKYLLFCFLPLPIQSNLPVHINGHFLVDDSRKHLETIQHEGLGNWNESIAQKVIVPAYVDLVIAVKDLLDDDSSRFYYSLFPKEDMAQTSAAATVVHKDKGGEVTEDKMNIGELINLNIVQLFYRELLQRNPFILLREMPVQTSAYTWMLLKSSLFCVPFLCGPLSVSKILSVSAELRQALVSLGMPITTAPNYIYNECTRVDPSFASKARIEPEKIVDHLRKLRCTNEQKEVIKNSIVFLLQYCILGYNSSSILSLFSNALYLVAKDGSLQRGYLFHSTFSELLPQCSDRFIDKSLEVSTIGEQLAQCKVIRLLPMDFVSAHISLPNTTVARSISDCNTGIIKLLWSYFIHCSQVSIVAGVDDVATSVNQYFSSKAIIPANDERLYPVQLSKILIRSSCSCDNCHVMKKLGYPSIDFSKIIQITDRNNLFYHIINNLTTCFQNGEDIINCFKLQPPTNLNIELIDEEVLAFVASFGKLPVNQLKQASQYLLKLPLFWTIDESRISLVGVTRVFILASTKIPLEGIPTRSENGRVILKAATTESMKKFYEGVIPSNIAASVSPEQFYIQLVLPILSELQEESVMGHVKYLYMERYEMEQAFTKLKDTPFIKHNGRLYKVSDLCDPKVKFYQIFKPDYILPKSWQKHSDILKELGLQSTVSTSEWLQFAREFSQNIVAHEANVKSTVLLQELFTIINKNPFNSELQLFLQNVAEIRFLYSPQTLELTYILSATFPEDRRKEDVYMVKFQGSVSVHEANLTCLCKSILPESCQQLISMPLYRQALQVELPASPETVAENLKRLCKRVSATCARLDLDQQHVSKLLGIFEAHYACLSKKKPPSHILSELKDMMCILPSKSHLLHLVKPSQLVMQLPSDCFLEPYCFKVMQWLQKHVDFLTAVGVKEELSAQDYVNILLSIKKEAENESSVHDKDSRVIESAYKQLVSCLRQGHSIQQSGDIYLPDESLNLTKVNELCLNNVPWYRSRLPPDCGFKIIYQPPTDDKGHRTLPGALKVKRLSEIVTEELQESCKSSDFECNDEKLFEIGKRPESRRCEFVRGILETLNSDELFHGFCRMYYTEYRSPPTSDFKALVKKLKQVRVRCVLGKLESVLSIDGKPIPETEDDSKLCHLCKENNERVLYIALHSDSLNESDLAQFYKHLAVYISKLINNEIRNMGPIAAIFECYPCDIPQVLTREQIYEYTEEDSQITKAVRIGTKMPWGSFSPHESLIVLNFALEDPVHYIGKDGSLVNAEIVDGELSGRLKTDITVRVKENDENECESAANLKAVSPLQLFKVLTASQKRSLWSGDTSPYASPVALATIPSDDPSEIEQWLIKIKQSLFTPHPELVQSILTLRLLGHLYYQLVIQKKNPTLFHTTASKLQDIFCQLEGHTSKADIVINLVRETIVTLISAGAAPVDAQTIFPSKELGDIIEGRIRYVPPQSVSTSSSTSASVGYVASGGGGGGGIVGAGMITGGGGSLGGSGSSGYSSSQSYVSQSGGSGGYTGSGSGIGATGGGGWSGRFSSRVRRGYQNPQFRRFRPAVYTQPSVAQQQAQPPQPATCMRSATAWLEQAKADFKAAETLLGSSVVPAANSEVAVEVNIECKFPALVCFLCHDTVEKCIKGVFYAFCGLSQNLVNCSNLVALHDDLNRTSHRPAHLMDAVNECVMTVNRHENRSRFPNYQNYPCAPAAIYSVEDAQEAFQATSKLLHLLQADGKLSAILQDLGQLPARRFMSALQYMPDNQDYPDNWDDMELSEEVKLSLLDPLTEAEEYERVINQFKLTLPDVEVLKIERIQNKILWRRYHNRCQLMKNFNTACLRDELLFHGTRQNKPELIYGGDEGFDKHCSREGLWGKGNYFAVNSLYSNSYAFRASSGVKKMFAAWVLTGNSICLPSNGRLVQPPFMDRPANQENVVQRRYDSVNGTTGGTRVYITYDNEHAYPAYLITYKD